ncbi:MAG: cytidine deaminase, partial [Proteobacteria bacterium]|nr:cytidine deaminase [Pseudomonadota bacterium]
EFFPQLEALLKNAYAPYSNFPVAAIIKGASGKIYSGVNVENAAYPQGWCAEASAIAAMVSSGETEIFELAVMAKSDEICTPCGGCRQKIREFASQDLKIFCFGPNGLKATYTLGELLPYSFGPEHLS